MWSSERLLERVQARVSQKEKKHVLAQGNESEYIRLLIRRDMKQEREEDRIERLVQQLVKKYQYPEQKETDTSSTKRAITEIALLFGGGKSG